MLHVGPWLRHTPPRGVGTSPGGNAAVATCMHIDRRALIGSAQTSALIYPLHANMCWYSGIGGGNQRPNANLPGALIYMRLDLVPSILWLEWLKDPVKFHEARLSTASGKHAIAAYCTPHKTCWHSGALYVYAAQQST